VLEGDGALRWRSALGAPVAAVAVDAAGGWIAAGTASGARGLLTCCNGEGHLIWECDLPSPPTGLAFSPAGHPHGGSRILALSLLDGHIHLYETDPAAAGSQTPGAVTEQAEALAATGDLTGARQHLLRALERRPELAEAARRLA